MPGFPVIR